MNEDSPLANQAVVLDSSQSWQSSFTRMAFHSEQQLMKSLLKRQLLDYSKLKKRMANLINALEMGKPQHITKQ